MRVQVPAHSHRPLGLCRSRRAAKLKSSDLLASQRHLRLLAPTLHRGAEPPPPPPQQEPPGARMPAVPAVGMLSVRLGRWRRGEGGPRGPGFPGEGSARSRRRWPEPGSGKTPDRAWPDPPTHRGALRGRGECLGRDAGGRGGSAVALARSVVLRLLKLAMGRTPAQETPAIGCH